MSAAGLATDILPERPPVRDALAAAGVTVDEGACREALVAPSDGSHQPWYVRALVGVGAWVSALLFLAAADLSGLFKETGTLGVAGVMAFAGGIVLRRSSRAEFPVQLALALSLGGRMALYAAVGEHHSTAACVVAVMFELISVAAYPDVVGRFAATVGACCALTGFVVSLELPWLSHEIVTLLIAAAATAVWRYEPELLAHPKTAPLERPVGFGLVVALLGALTTELWWFRSRSEPHHDGVLALGLTALLVLLERDVLREALAYAAPRAGYRDAPAREGERALPAHAAPPGTKALVYAGTLALGVLGQLVPGLMGALLVMALGVNRRNRLLFALATPFLLFFGSHFYYSLEISLLVKSGALLGSGLLMLALRLPIARRATS